MFEGKLHPVYFWRKKVSISEVKWNSFILQVKAAYLPLKKFRYYLRGMRFKLATDYAVFQQTTCKQDVPREVGQWILYLQDLSFEVEHCLGKKMKYVHHFTR